MTKLDLIKILNILKLSQFNSSDAKLPTGTLAKRIVMAKVSSCLFILSYQNHFPISQQGHNPSRGCCHTHPILPGLGFHAGKSPCGPPPHHKCLMVGTVDLLKPPTFWASPWPPLRIVSYRNSQVSRASFWVACHMPI